ncbi:hypothetical protein LTR85_006030 [Meristemomyces frigidus]|nr:hypothetical protein LTR85_006030 [Meristemomyces frigidus]
MPFQDIDIEKQQLVTETEVSPTSPSGPNRRDSLYVYQTLVGDVSANHGPDDGSLYHEIVSRQRKATFLFFLSGFAFAFFIMAQIVLCLGIAVGAQLSLTMNQITILATVNTGVAAAIAVLKGLGLPEKMAIERRKLEKIAERIRFTTRRLKAGLTIDAAQEADEVKKMQDEAEDEAQILQHAGDASAAVPTIPQKS